jgi:hypothetical protein
MMEEDQLKVKVLSVHAEQTSEIEQKEGMLRPLAEIRAWGEMFRKAADDLIQFSAPTQGVKL